MTAAGVVQVVTGAADGQAFSAAATRGPEAYPPTVIEGEPTPIKPPRLRAGDRLASTSLSWCGVAREGPTVVRCLEVLTWLRGTDWWPSMDQAVLVLETSEEQPPPSSTSFRLRTLAVTGELHRLAGLVLGRPEEVT